MPQPNTFRPFKPFITEGDGTATQPAGMNNVDIDLTNIHPNAQVTIRHSNPLRGLEGVEVIPRQGISVVFDGNDNEDSTFTFEFDTPES